MAATSETASAIPEKGLVARSKRKGGGESSTLPGNTNIKPEFYTKRLNND